MGLWDKLMGRDSEPDPGRDPAAAPGRRGVRQSADDPDEQAIERYRYLLRTAPPDQVEQAHAEAFAKLTPEQRQQVLTQLGAEVPLAERAQSDDPQALARMATRAEMRQPGTLERTLGRPGGMGMGGLVAGSLLASVAGAFIGTAIAGSMFDDAGSEADASGAEDPGAGSEDPGGDYYSGADSGGVDYGGADYGGGGDWGVGGGDFGGGFDGGV